MDKQVPTIPAVMRVKELSDRLARGDTQLTRRQGTPIIDKEGRLVGIITRSDLVRALEQDGLSEKTVLEAGARHLVVAYPDETLREAVEKMLENDIGRLPVVRRDDPHQLIGYVGRSGILRARLKVQQEERVRERSWARSALPRL